MNVWRWPRLQPEADWHGGMTLWRFQLSDGRDGEVAIRKSDRRIRADFPNPIPNSDDARTIAAALLSAAEAWDVEE